MKISCFENALKAAKGVWWMYGCWAAIAAAVFIFFVMYFIIKCLQCRHKNEKQTMEAAYRKKLLLHWERIHELEEHMEKKLKEMEDYDEPLISLI